MKSQIQKRIALIAALYVCTIPSLSAQQIDYKGFPEWSWHKEGDTEYYLYTPKGMLPGRKYPVALYLHGCCGVDDHATLKNCVDPPVRMWHNFGANTQRIPTYIIAPATSHGWKQHISDLKKVMDSLIANGNADAKRMYICGFSMGAEGTFTFINEYPDYFAAVMTMGMKFHGDSVKLKNLPMWINQGETDYYSRPVRRQVKDIRVLNGDAADTGAGWVTGVNPLYSNFKGFGHVILWEAASRQDMVSWAYSKVNDGNKYPSVFFEQPGYESTVQAGKPLTLLIRANDDDGSISKLDIYLNRHFEKTLTKAPYSIDIVPLRGRNSIEAVATDNGGKSGSAWLYVKTEISLKALTKTLPAATAGKYYRVKLAAEGYGQIRFLAETDNLPQGLELTPSGYLQGIPVEKGTQDFYFTICDSSHHVNANLKLKVKPKVRGTVLVTNVITTGGTRYKVSIMKTGEPPNFDSKDTVPPIWKDQINFSNLDKYAGLTFIEGDVNDTSKTAPAFLSFHVDENVIVYVGYETLDLHFQSTIPDWLQQFDKQKGQIVAQFKYYNVYAKKFPKGKITLAGADARRNKVGTNYFVMIKKDDNEKLYGTSSYAKCKKAIIVLTYDDALMSQLNIAIPQLETAVGGVDYVDTLRRNGIVKYAHMGGDSTVVVTDFSNLDPLLVPSWAVTGKITGANLISFVKKAAYGGGLGIFMFHGVGGDYITTTAPAHRELLAYLNSHRNTLQVMTFQQAMDYISTAHQHSTEQ